MSAPIGEPAPWHGRFVRRPIVWFLQRVAPDSSLWYDVATFSMRGHQCVRCGRLSHTERVHLSHRCAS